MASVNFSEKEYMAVCGAAMDTLRKGDREDAKLLNELASKMNHSLTAARYPVPVGFRAVQRIKYRAPGPLDEQLGISNGDSAPPQRTDR